jgi:hypothetical protein
MLARAVSRAHAASRTLGLTALLCALAASARAADGAARSPASGGRGSPPSLVVSIGTAHTGAVIPSSFLGLSLETTALAAPAVVSSAPSLSRLMRELGPGMLRISGVSVDRTQWMSAPAPAAPWRVASVSPGDLRNLMSLMSASGWRLLLGLDLGHLLATALVEEARAATVILGRSLAGVEIGNEPDLYTRPPSAPFRLLLGDAALRPPAWGLSQYENEISGLRAALAFAGVAAPLYGPDTARLAWLESYAQEQGHGLAALAQHIYPLDRCHRGRLLRTGPSLASLLSRRTARRESRLIAGVMRVARGRGLPLRIGEANSVSCAGQADTSDTFGAALWAVDFSLIAARAHVGGINFHGGLGSCLSGGTITSPWYSPLCTMPSGRLRVRPEYYALLLLRSLEGCAFVSADYRTSRNISVYALRAPDGSLRVVIDDMEPGGTRPKRGGHASAPAAVVLRVARTYARASVMRLTAHDIGAKGGVSFGGASVAVDGSFAGTVPEALAGGNGSFVVAVRPASVAVVTLSAGATGARRARER